MDKGRAHIRKYLDRRAYAYHVEPYLSGPAKPTDHPLSKSLNGPFGYQCLNLNGLRSINCAQEKFYVCRQDHHTFGHLSALGAITPSAHIELHYNSSEVLVLAAP